VRGAAQAEAKADVGSASWMRSSRKTEAVIDTSAMLPWAEAERRGSGRDRPTLRVIGSSEGPLWIGGGPPVARLYIFQLLSSPPSASLIKAGYEARRNQNTFGDD
jgi:hypothetical protein